MLSWLQVRIKAEIELVESLYDIFYNNGFSQIHLTDFFEKDGHRWFELATYLPKDDSTAQLKDKLEKQILEIREAEIAQIEPLKYSEIKGEDLSRAIESHPSHHWPTKNIAVTTAHTDIQLKHDKISVALSPSSAFGTGLHPSTILAMQAMEKHLKPHMKILDAGCGSGILSLVAAKLGSDTITAIDIDPKAIAACKANVKLNNLQQSIQIVECAISDVDETFDLVIANMSPSLLLLQAKYIQKTVAATGLLILSGITKQHETEIVKDFGKYNLAKINKLSDNNWKALILRREQKEKN